MEMFEIVGGVPTLVNAIQARDFSRFKIRIHRHRIQIELDLLIDNDLEGR